MLVYFEPAAMCDHPSTLLLAPLPANKMLWEAQDEIAWKKELDREVGGKKAFALAADGELVELCDARVDCGEMVVAGEGTGEGEGRGRGGKRKWEEWCKGMDGFGGLVVLAAASVG